jgi:glycosyltransferase involved in cell wall biosynthesis
VTLPPSERDIEVVYLPPSAWPTGLAAVVANTTIDQELGRRRMSELGVRVRIVNPFKFPWNPLAKKGGYLRGLDPLRVLQVLFRCRRATAIICVTESSALVLLLLRRFFFFRPKVLLWDASLGNPWKFLQWVQRRVFPRADGFLLLTTRQVELLKTMSGVHGITESIGYYVDDQFFHPKFNTLETTILSIGDDLTRDYDTLMEAVRALADTLVTLKTRWRPTTPAPVHFRFIDRRLNDVEFRQLYADAKLVVVPLHEADSPGGVTALFEALAMGKAVIVTESPISKDFVTHGYDAWVVPPGDAIALREAIEMLLKEDELRKSLAVGARHSIETKFSSRNAAQRQLDAILRIVNK